MAQAVFRTWTCEPLVEIHSVLALALRDLEPGSQLAFRVPDPDRGSGLLPGQRWTYEGRSFRHRSYRNWLDLAEILHCRLLTPRPADPPWVQMRFEKLDAATPPTQKVEVQERYGRGSSFYAVQKLEEPCFLQDLQTAYERVDALNRRRVLDLGVHRGDELLPLQKLWASNPQTGRQCVGVDHCPSALEEAGQNLQDPAFSFLCDDISHYEAWNFDPFDLIVSIGTLQCRGVEGKSIFPTLLRSLLAKNGAVILGFPYLRYIDGEIRQGGQMRNFSQSEHALVFKDLMFYRKLLLRRAERVTITGRYYLFLTAWSRTRRSA